MSPEPSKVWPFVGQEEYPDLTALQGSSKMRQETILRTNRHVEHESHRYLHFVSVKKCYGGYITSYSGSCRAQTSHKGPG
jgi:hypothetical protein